MVGTLVTSTIALIIGVPVAVAGAVFINELCPRRLRAPLTILVDLLAAVPSVVYGLWGVFVLAPQSAPGREVVREHVLVHPVDRGRHPDPLQLLHRRPDPRDHDPADRLGDLPRGDRDRSGRAQGGGAGARGDALGDDPDGGASVLACPGSPAARCSGWAARIGETIAVVLVIGNAPMIGGPPVQPGLHAGGGDRQRVRRGDRTPHSSALFAAGLVLFVLTLIVNIIARWFVVARRRAVRRHRRDRHDDRRRPPRGEADERARYHASRRSAARRRRTDKVMRAVLLAATVIALDPAGPDHLLPAPQRSERVERQLLHDRSERQLLRQPGRDPQRDPRLARDRRARHADLGPDRDRRRPVPDRVRQGRSVRERRPLLRRRDDGRAVDHVRPVHLHRAGDRPRRRCGFAAWKGAIALALLMLPIVIRSSEVVLLLVPEQPARGRARARRSALAGGAPGRAADGGARARHRLAAGGRPRHGRDRAAAVHGRRAFVR